jgi:2-oxoisovalerate dehydrogenase E1 component
MHFDRKNFSDRLLWQLYKNLLLSRSIEEKMLVLLRQGKISKWFSGIGQEAISVGATAAMQPDEWIMPLHRNLGVFTGRGLALSKLFMQWQGNKNGYSKGRERSFHFGCKENFVCGMISHLGPQLAVADGAALAYKLKKESKVSLTFTGEGGTSEGDFHEALNLASVWDLPVIFIIENNGYALSTPSYEQYRCEQLTDKARGYGMEAVTIDGNNVLEVYDTMQGVREYCARTQRPYLIECRTFRMRGHEEASGTKYIPEELFTRWAEKDPVKSFEEFLLSKSLFLAEQVEEAKKETAQYIEEELRIAFEAEDYLPDTEEELADVYAPSSSAVNSNKQQLLAQQQSTEETSSTNKRKIRFIDAITEALKQSMRANSELVLMGQDIAEYGGAFKVTEGFVDEFGKERVRNTPLCESAVIGAALGLSLEGFKTVVEMQFADFVSVGFNQIVNNLAKIHYRWGQNADVVIRMPTGGTLNAGPFHSQSNEAWFVHTPGLKVVYPATPDDAKGLLIAAINDPNPVMFFEHKALYRKISGSVPEDHYETEIGKAAQIRQGDDLSIITYGMGVHWALNYAQANPHLSLDILDLRTLLPFDKDAIRAGVQRTGKVIILHEDTLTGGIGGEISAWITEHCFELLDAPITRCASLDTPVPFNHQLEKNFMANSRLAETVEYLLNY